MKRVLLLVLLAGLARVCGYAQDSAHIVHRVILIGDAGELDKDGKHPTAIAVRKRHNLDKNTTIVYLGDNLYREGLPDEQLAIYTGKRTVLDSQAALAKFSQGMVYMIPGNHDWQNGGNNGYAAIVRQQRYIDGLGLKNLKFYPEDGCPGPVEVEISKDVVLVMFDSQWWIHPSQKPGIESDCPTKTEAEVLAEFSDIIGNNYRKLLIFAAHHPFKSNGIHGGFYTLKQHIFPLTDLKKNLYIPLPIIGSIYPISRGVFGTPEDLRHPAYANMIAEVDAVLKEHPHVIHVAGHEHTLQYIADSNNHYIVSGSGCKIQRVSKSKRAKFVADKVGYAILDIYDNKDVRLEFYSSTEDSTTPLWTGPVLNFSKLPEQEASDTVVATAAIKDSVIAHISHQYSKRSGIRRLFLGENYRQEWETQVHFPTLHLRDLHGGLKVIGAGGGKQTKSLHLVDAEGVEWSLRTLDKDPEKALPLALRGSVAEGVVQEMISAAHPYAPLTIPPLADAAGVFHANPRYYYVPDDPALGYYRRAFANTICLLEERDASHDGKSTKSSAKIVNKLIEEADHTINQEMTLRARLLDMYVGDWDRHWDQWRWGEYDTGIGKVYYPIPRDRDQAYFNSRGLIIKAASYRRMPWFRGFKSRLPKFNYLSRSARDFDRMFLNSLEERDWRRIATEFRECMTDTLISSAIHRLPPEIYPLHGPDIERKLRARREILLEKAVQYHRFISKKVNVLGSNKQEYFTVKGTDTGILVQVHKREDGDTVLLVYSRTFNPKVTKEVRLYGFNGNDKFSIDESAKGSMRVRMIGGLGSDTFDVRGRVRNYLYDLTSGKNTILEHRRTRNRFEEDASVNAFSPIEFQYKDQRFPYVNLGYNPDDGLLVGLGYYLRTHGFRKTPYETQHRLTTLYSFGAQAYQIKYTGAFNGLLNKNDLLINANLQNPAISNFFGFGNNTEITSPEGLKFYRARYKHTDGDFLLQRRLFGGKVRYAFGPSYYYYWNKREPNEDKVLDRPEVVGLDSFDVYDRKYYFGGRAFVNINNVNSELFPTRGINWHNEILAQAGFGKYTDNLTTLRSDMTIYASLTEPARLIAVLRAGGGHILSKNFEWFQGMGIGQNNYLRGFRKNRFIGRSMAYGSAELRCKLFDVSGYIVPGAFGLIAFDDVGRVWMDGEESRRWHNSYGGGIYYIPYNLVIFSGTVAFSEDKQPLVNITIGARLGLTF